MVAFVAVDVAVAMFGLPRCVRWSKVALEPAKPFAGGFLPGAPMVIFCERGVTILPYVGSSTTRCRMSATAAPKARNKLLIEGRRTGVAKVTAPQEVLDPHSR
ncbi:hypothetical protein PIB19_05980 [Sphingomonas sp. 7/4-4]|uniref:hypothetical protein n=1 Tax=Sphingomonas sp. 7/4-4 TaxID=3018446 RepID=UPI0022F3A00E|nr:hypothetical protein [Sphingomonas sp. 7/4-4]WBY08945.1 hypothetical protein PIB19_05980 [Sphingomonas sp. 7/4-4]